MEILLKAFLLAVKDVLMRFPEIRHASILKVVIFGFFGLVGIALVVDFIEWFWDRIKGHENSEGSDLKARETAVKKLDSNGDIRVIEPLLTTLEDNDNMREAETEQRYKLINRYIQEILKSIPQKHIYDYDYLMQNHNLVADPEYQRRYRDFWKLIGPVVSPDFCSVYFATLQEHMSNNNTNLEQVVRKLYKIPTNTKGQRKIHSHFHQSSFIWSIRIPQFMIQWLHVSSLSKQKPTPTKEKYQNY